MSDPDSSDADADADADAPEEFTAEQGIQQDEEIARIKKENKARIAREAKEERRKWAKRKTPKPSKKGEKVKNLVENESEKDSPVNGAMLPNDIVQLLAAQEKKVFTSDSDEEEAERKPIQRKKRLKSSGKETVILKEIAAPPCLQNSLDFLKKKKMQLPRSSSVLNNSNQALRLISNCGLLSKKDKRSVLATS